MQTWSFRSVAQRTRASSAYQWYWQIDTQHTPIAITSMRLFATIEECIANARQNGFSGEVDVPDRVTHPAHIACVQGEDGPGVVWQPVGGRANRRAA